jgi:probable F420-dependent oxidoreductase
MKINFTVPNCMHIEAMTQPWEHALTGKDVIESVRLADELGFHKALLGEHFIVPDPYAKFSGGHYFSSAVALAAFAGQTSRIKLGSSLTILPLQNPVVQAKNWATLDWMSDGRAVPMFGVGWMTEEFTILNVPFEKRGAASEEYIRAMIELWHGGAPSFHGEFVTFDNAVFEPKPVQDPMPIWFGGDAEPVLKRIARYGDGWQPFQLSPEKFREKLDFIQSRPDYHGRKLDVFLPQEMLNVTANHETRGDDRGVGHWDAARSIDQCRWLAGLGVTETSIPVPPVADFEAYKDRMRWVAAEIIPAVAAI